MNIESQLKIPRITKLKLPELLHAASSLKASGKIMVNATNLTYLKIDDNYIHQLFPLLNDKTIQKPQYFGPGSTGAHISVIYSEENKTISKQDLNQEHEFTIKDIATAEINTKLYYVLLAESPTLIALRRRYHLSDLLHFRGYLIGFHITFGFIPLSSPNVN